MRFIPIYAIGSVVFVIALCTIMWVILQQREMEPVKIYKSVALEQGQASEEKADTEEKRDINDVQWAREAIMKSLEERKPESSPGKIAYKNALESPAFAEYQKKQNANFPRFDLRLWWDFLESQGLGSGRMLQEKRFREHFPLGEYTDYEPMMRRKLADIFLEMGPPDSLDEEDIELHRRAAMYEFRKEDANLVWARGHFNGYVGDIEWARDVQRNASSIVAPASLEQGGTEPLFMETEIADTFSDTTDATEERLEPDSQNSLTGEVLPPFEDFQEIPQTVEELQAELMKDIFADIPNLPNNTDFEKSLRENFSPQRFSTAMQTLTQYGREEGLRRIKEADPEMATHLEPLIQRKKDVN